MIGDAWDHAQKAIEMGQKQGHGEIVVSRGGKFSESLELANLDEYEGSPTLTDETLSLIDAYYGSRDSIGPKRIGPRRT